MKFAVRIVLWLGAIALTIFGLLLMAGALDSSGSDAAGRGLSQAYGMFIALLGGAAVLSLLLTRFWRGFLVIGGLFLALPFILMLLLSIGRNVEERRNDQFTADVHSGRYNFGEHPELLAVAEAIAKNDSNAIRASAKNVRDLNAAGRDGMTLLFFAVNDREQQLPEKTADAAARSKPEEQMPDPGGEQDPADDDRDTNPGSERQTDSQKPADQHENPPNHIAFATHGS